MLGSKEFTRLLHEQRTARFMRALLKVNPERKRRKSLQPKPAGRMLRLTGATFGFRNRQGGNRRCLRLSKKHILRWVAGWMFMVLGAAGLFLPILQGVLFLLIGMILLAPYIPLFRRLRIRLLLKFPSLRARLVRWREARRRRNRARRGDGPP